MNICSHEDLKHINYPP